MTPLSVLLAVMVCSMVPGTFSSPTDTSSGVVVIRVSSTSIATGGYTDTPAWLYVDQTRGSSYWVERDRRRGDEQLRRLVEEFKALLPKAVPRGRLHARPELRIARPGYRATIAPRAIVARATWLAGRQGHPRETRPARSRRRLRTWERPTP